VGLLEKDGLVDVVAGPDSYKDLPRLVSVNRQTGQSAINVMLSQDETYSHLAPVRLNKDSVTAYLSIQRGCDNMCSYCIVPFTRGRERSRPVATILEEVRKLSDAGVKELTLLGQNVNSYRDTSETTNSAHSMAQGFRTVYKPKIGGLRFVDLLERVSRINPEMRIRFTSPHPKDFPEEVLHLISDRVNICNNIHLPAQCGSDKVLSDMRRGYTMESYKNLVQLIRKNIPNVALTSDFIVGFCGETEEEFEQTVSVVKSVQYHKCFIFPYSLREKTGAHRKLKDDVPEAVKTRRFNTLRNLYRSLLLELHQSYIGTIQKVLITGPSKRSHDDFQGTADNGVKVIFPKCQVLDSNGNSTQGKPGDYANIRINSASAQVLKGDCLKITKLNS